MNYSAELLEVDRRRGRLVTLADCRRLSEKSAAQISDDDLVIIENFLGAKAAAESRAARTKALAPPAPPPAPVATKAAAPEATSSATDLSWDQYVEKHSARPMTVKMAASVFEVLIKKWSEMNERNKERNARLDALEQRSQALETRVLELEAEIAARTVEHVER